MTNQVHSADEIVSIFTDSSLDDEFKGVILARYNAILQGMYNAVHSPNTTMKMQDTHKDLWVEEHNRVVTEYQRVYS